MPRFETVREFDATYSFDRFQLNDGVPPSALARGEFSRLAGVDGRYRGGLRVFPGFQKISWGLQPAGLKVFRGFSVQKGNSDVVIHGFLVLHESGGNQLLELRYWDGSWKTYTLSSAFTGSQNDLDVTVAGKLLIVTGAYEEAGTTELVDIEGSVGVTVSGTYTGPGAITQYRVVVNIGASPDTFSAFFQQKQVVTNQVIVAGTPYLLEEGISVTFSTDAHANPTEFFVLVKKGGPATVWWDDDLGDFTQEPSGSGFDDYPLGYLTSNFQVTDQIPPGNLGILSSNINRCQQATLNSFLKLRLTDTGEAGTTPFLEGDGGVYGIAWRLRDTRRNVYTPLSMAPYGPLDVEGTFLLKVYLAKNNWVTVRDQSRWDRLEIFRTGKDLSTFYKEWEVDLDAHTGTEAESLRAAYAIVLTLGGVSGWSGAVDPTYTLEAHFQADLLGGLKTINVFPGILQAPAGKHDIALVGQPYYTLDRDSTLIIPANATRIGNFQGITVIQADGIANVATDDVQQRTNTSLAYSSLAVFRPEMFPATNSVTIPQRDGKVQQFQAAGDFLYAVTANAMWRLQRSGSRFAANRVNVGWGITNNLAMIEANNDLFLVTRRGVIRVEAGTATPVLLATIERKILDEWRDEVAAGPDTGAPGEPPLIQTAFDAVLGAVFILNTVKRECILLWTATGQITTLEDVPWTLMTTLPDPEKGGSVRVWFTKADDALIYRADPEREAAAGPTMLPQLSDTDLNAASGSTTTISVGVPIFADAMIGHAVYVQHPTTGAYEKAVIDSQAGGTEITFSPALSFSVVNGTRFIMSPIRFNVVASPIEGQTPEDRFHRRTIHGMWAQPVVLAGSLQAGSRWTYEAYTQSKATPDAVKDAIWDSTEDGPGELPGYLPFSGTILRPGWLCVEPSVHYELLNGRVTGKIKVTDKSK